MARSAPPPNGQQGDRTGWALNHFLRRSRHRAPEIVELLGSGDTGRQRLEQLSRRRRVVVPRADELADLEMYFPGLLEPPPPKCALTRRLPAGARPSALIPPWLSAELRAGLERGAGGFTCPAPSHCGFFAEERVLLPRTSEEARLLGQNPPTLDDLMTGWHAVAHGPLMRISSVTGSRAHVWRVAGVGPFPPVYWCVEADEDKHTTGTIPYYRSIPPPHSFAGAHAVDLNCGAWSIRKHGDGRRFAFAVLFAARENVSGSPAFRVDWEHRWFAYSFDLTCRVTLAMGLFFLEKALLTSADLKRGFDRTKTPEHIMLEHEFRELPWGDRLGDEKALYRQRGVPAPSF